MYVGKNQVGKNPCWNYGRNPTGTKLGRIQVKHTTQ